MEYLITPQPAGFVPPQCFEIFTLPFPLRIGNGTVSTNALSLCKKTKFNVLTQRRISDILAELDMLGIINAKIISKGRYGRTREVSLSIDHSLQKKLKEILEKSLQL